MNKRKLFSDADGTKLGEDSKDIFNELKSKLFDFVRKHGDIAEKIINLLKLVDEQIKEGTPADQVIDRVLAQIKIKGDPDEKLYKFIQDNLHGFISSVEDFIDGLELFDGDDEMLAPIHAEYESARHKTASIILEGYLKEQGEEISRVDSDTCIQTVYWLGVSG